MTDNVTIIWDWDGLVGCCSIGSADAEAEVRFPARVNPVDADSPVFLSPKDSLPGHITSCDKPVERI